jgi:hypothetical protein
MTSTLRRFRRALENRPSAKRVDASLAHHERLEARSAQFTHFA